MNKNALWELWDPALYTKGPKRSLCTCASGNTQTLVRAMGPGEPAILPQTLLPVAREDLESADLGKYPKMRENLLKSSLPKRRFQHAVRKKLYEFVHSGEGKRNFARAASPSRTTQ